jgi:hypothetical protein
MKYVKARLLAAVSGMLLSFLVLGAVAARKNDDSDQPQISGMQKGNVGCAILGKRKPVKGKLLLAGVVYARTEYDVLETFNYKMPKEKFTGPGEVDELNRLAIRDKVKLVLIPAKHSPEELDEARKLCRQ